MSVAHSIICICIYLIAAGRKENKKVTFATFTLYESNCKLLELQIWRAFARIWIRRFHNLLTTLSGGNGGRWEREVDRVREWGWWSRDGLEDIDFRHLRVRIVGMAGLVHIKALSWWLEVTVEQGVSDVERMCVGGTVWVHPGLTASLWFYDKVISRYREMGQSFPLYFIHGWPNIDEEEHGGISLSSESNRQTLSC